MQKLKAGVVGLGVLAASATGCQRSTAVLTVGAAASLQDVLPRVAPPGMSIHYTFAASSLLAQQALHGAPIDVLVTADMESQQPLVAAHLLEPGDPQTCLTNSVVLLVRPGLEARIHQVSDLRTVPIHHLALCEPAVPIGHYALQALSSAGVDPRSLGPVTMSDVRAVVAVLESGNADAGFAYRTDFAISHSVRIACTVPDLQARYGVSVLKNSSLESAAQAYVEHLRSGAAQAVFREAGFGPP